MERCSYGTLVSILVPVYNVNRYIQKCAVSLFEQSYPNIEYIFVDDCSPDDSIAILYDVISRYPKRKAQIKIISHKINKGLAEARNTAVNAATGKYIMHVDSDDYLERETIAIMLAKAVEKAADMVVCDFNNIYQNKVVKTTVKVVKDKLHYLSLILTRRTTVNIWGRIIKRDLLIENSIYAIPGLNHGEDYVVIPRIIFHCKNIEKVDLALYNYIRYNVSSYTNGVNEKAIDDTIRANQLIIDFFTKVGYDNILPLRESLAVNAVTLFYCSDKCYFKKIANTCSMIKISSLRISVLHKFLLILSRRKMYNTLYVLIAFINKCRVL